MKIVLRGKVQAGKRDASHWLDKSNEAYSRKRGMPVFPGSLNLALDENFDWFAPRWQPKMTDIGLRHTYGLRQKRPADVIGNAVHVMRIATGEIDDTAVDDGKDPAAKTMGSKGGAARAASMSPERRAEIDKAAAAKCWAK